ncbi:oxysterol binding family protein [Tieghemostelium lacteum]|uniref:Oxysterol binding family protein n=1 Tax=Tieghemostelium lacteum TaxID=361077 RepID=A0A151Z414_TIELA|nr:oxysterol binding family protein [Tieghemostelium lacteum]|eukprot:KYQ88657.1 oxysterol binding family protein [Tieghemostelium lacteum]
MSAKISNGNLGVIKDKDMSLTEDSVSDLSSDGVEVEGVDQGTDSGADNILVDDGSSGSTEGIMKQAFGFIKNHLKVGADMTRLPIPATFVAPISFLQAIQQQSAIYSHLLLSAPTIKDDGERFLQVLKYHMTWPKMYFPKNPLNPILGETYECSVQHLDEKTQQPMDQGKTVFMAEQVSHHPPVSCFHFQNEKHGFSFDSRQQITPVFKGKCIRATMDIKSCVTLHRGGDVKETYMNDKFCEGYLRLLRWKFEFSGKYNFTCPETGYSAAINFKDKPLLSGKWHDVQIIVSKGSEALYDIHGTHVDVLTITNLKDKSSSVFLNYNTLRQEPVQDLPFDTLKENASARVWKGVCESFLKKDGRKAGLEKQKIEEYQRKKAKALLAKDPNYHFKPIYFMQTTPESPLKSDYIFNSHPSLPTQNSQSQIAPQILSPTITPTTTTSS